MSIELTVRVPVDGLPTPQQWQAAISDHGFKLVLDTDLDMQDFSGYLPCEIDRVSSGFEYYWGRRDHLSESQESVVTLVTHSDLLEFLCAAIAAAVLASVSEGILEDPQQGQSWGGEQAVDWARQVEREISTEPASQEAQSSTDAARGTRRRPWWRFWQG